MRAGISQALVAGTMFAPSDINRGFGRGMRGYAPEEPDSVGCVLSSHAPQTPVQRLSGLHRLGESSVVN